MRSGEPWRSTWPPAGGNNRDIYWVHLQNVLRENVPRDKTSQRTIRPNGQYVPTDKTSQRTKRPRAIRSQGQNVPRTKHPKDKTSQGKKTSYINTKNSKTYFVLENYPHMLQKVMGLISALNF